MLVISGIAESMKDKSPIIQGQKYIFNIFTTNESLDDQLELIKKFFVDKGWNNISIDQQEFIDDDVLFEHEILQNAFNLAKNGDLTGVINNTPIIDNM